MLFFTKSNKGKLIVHNDNLIILTIPSLKRYLFFSYYITIYTYTFYLKKQENVNAILDCCFERLIYSGSAISTFF